MPATARATDDRLERELTLRTRFQDDFAFYAENCLKIRAKDGSIQPLALNTAQMYLHQVAAEQIARTGMVRLICLKGRQQGVSTFIGGRFYHAVSHRKGMRAFILTHMAEATDNLFKMTARYHENCPQELRPATGKSNAKELTFTRLDSGYKVATAHTEGIGRSDTIQLFHWSEVALSEGAEEHLAGALQAVPNLPGTEIWLESTSQGIGNVFHRECMKAIKKRGDFEFVFIPWFWQTEYRRPVEGHFDLDQVERDLVEQFGLDNEQLAWRRAKVIEIGPQKFKQEYPNTVEEAFEISGPRVLIGTKALRSAIDRDVQQVTGPIIWGVDCSLGGDRSTVAKRRTNKLLEPVKTLLEGETSYDTFAVARAVLREYRDTPPAKRPSTICVDSIGIGAGVSAQMRQDHLPVMDVNVSERTSSKARFMRLRDELWWTVREWFEDLGVSMPEDEGLVVELAGIVFDDSSAAGRIKIESKKDMITRLGHSPDLAEAFMLTFAASDLPDKGRSYEPPNYEGEVG